jgi:hypothetical protein
MKLTLSRKTITPDSTTGQLYVDGQPFCYTLELPVIDGMPGSAIPEGTYPVVLAPSPKFMASDDTWVLRYAQLIPHIIHIPDRTNILIHFGNLAQDTEGCILVGMTLGTNFIGNSRLAFEKLWSAIETPARSNNCTITVQNHPLQPAELSLEGVT